MEDKKKMFQQRPRKIYRGEKKEVLKRNAVYMRCNSRCASVAKFFQKIFHHKLEIVYLFIKPVAPGGEEKAERPLPGRNRKICCRKLVVFEGYILSEKIQKSRNIQKKIVIKVDVPQIFGSKKHRISFKIFFIFASKCEKFCTHVS